MKKMPINRHSLEILEARIAPANVPLGAQWLQASHSVDGSPIVLKEGQGLSTDGPNGGDYLVYLAKGNALIFTTDFNNNNFVDFNEITGIAAGEGMRLISFVDIHGDIATNLREVTTSSGLSLSLTDSNSNPADDVNHPTLRGDGRMILNNRIEAIELRTLTIADIPDQNGDLVVDETDVDLRRAPSTHSIFGNIYAGRGFGVPGDATSGLLIDSTINTNFSFENDTKPMIGSIFVGSAVTGEYFSFGVSGQFESSGGVMSQRIRAGKVLGDDVQGYIVPFVPSPGQVGASIAFVRSKLPTQMFNLNGLYAGNGGANAAGGDIMDITISGDDAGGYDIVAGTGGDGTRGGAGGSIILGNGGQGFTQGGSGASLSRAIVTQVTSIGETAGTAWGTSHNPSYYNGDPSTDLDEFGLPKFQAHIGTQQSFDIDGDGTPDFVYSTHDISQLVVLFGDPTFPTSFRVDRIYLDAPRNAEAMTVADLNGDGRPDIAAASSDLGNQSGIAVYLAKWSDVNADGDVMDAEDQFIGFHSPRYSSLPQLETGDQQTLSNSFLPYWNSPQQVSQLVAGDFDGDGANELAAVITYYDNIKTEVNGVTTGFVSPAYQVLMFLSPDRELDTNTGKYFLTGQFYADFGTKRVTTSTADAGPQPRYPFVQVSDSGPGTVFIEATALSTTSDHDVIVAGILGADHLRVYEYFERDPIGPGVASEPLELARWGLGEVDTDRRTGPNFVSPAEAHVMDFAIVDFNADDLADAVVVSNAPANFVLGIRGELNALGEVDGTGVQDSGNGADQSGYLLPQGNARGIKAFNGADYALLIDGLAPGAIVRSYDYRGGVQTNTTGSLALVTLTSDQGDAGSYHDGNVNDRVMWDVYMDTAVLGNNDAFPRKDLVSNLAFREQWAQPQLNIIAGNGGDSFIGKGGNGGFLGGKGKFETIVDPLTTISFTDFAGAIKIEYEGAILLQAGDGGLGFSRGGNGGSVSGVSVRDPGITNVAPGVAVFAGDGGRGVSGTGGIGGDLIANSILNGQFFIAGIGGDGKFGGRGGSVIGNGLSIGTSRVYDTDTAYAEIIAGAGGNGIRSGGAGGSVVNMRPIIEGNGGVPGAAGALSYVAGAGGNAVSGAGGSGGSVINSSPELNAVLEDQIFIEAGRGGDGRTGGTGGSVTKFAVTQSLAPARIVHILAGHGGDGSTGIGGRGGSVSAIDVKSVGTTELVLFSTPGSSFFTYSRILAGDGGASFGARGGEGGSVSNVVTGASQGTIAVVGGAGGDGLTQGGLGGSIKNLTFAALGGGTNAKGLIIAGAGGDARAFLPNIKDGAEDQDKKAFGGRIGVGGHGGSINGFTQLGATGAHVDLIAGNGGSTIHYGTVFDPKPFVGRGGSVSNINMAGSAGAISPNSPIKGYNDALSGESVQDFVESRLRVGQALYETIGDGDGNVGIIVGAAGRNKAVRVDPLGQPYDYIDQPATGAKNGDLINFKGRGIMAAVAGSVDRLAAIQLARNIKVDLGFVGEDKDTVGTFDYLNEVGLPVVNPVRDGRLVDGAFIAKVIQQPAGVASLVGRIFSF